MKRVERTRACVCGRVGCTVHGRSGWQRYRPPANAYAYSGDWPQRVRAVLKRDGYVCQLHYDICVGRASQVDHIVQPEAGGTGDLSNLRAVCVKCHARRTGRQGAIAKQRAAKRRRRT
jgi:5-methylcytosine-specific restriction protein A